MDIEQMVITIVEDLGASVSDELDVSIFDRFGADDLDGLEILMEIEEQFGIESQITTMKQPKPSST